MNVTTWWRWRSFAPSINNWHYVSTWPRRNIKMTSGNMETKSLSIRRRYQTGTRYHTSIFSLITYRVWPYLRKTTYRGHTTISQWPSRIFLRQTLLRFLERPGLCGYHLVWETPNNIRKVCGDITFVQAYVDNMNTVCRKC